MELEYILQWLSDGRATLSEDGSTVTFVNTLTDEQKGLLRQMVILAQDRHEKDNEKLAVKDKSLTDKVNRLKAVKNIL